MKTLMRVSAGGKESVYNYGAEPEWTHVVVNANPTDPDLTQSLRVSSDVPRDDIPMALIYEDNNATSTVGREVNRIRRQIRTLQGERMELRKEVRKALRYEYRQLFTETIERGYYRKVVETRYREIQAWRTKRELVGFKTILRRSGPLEPITTTKRFVRTRRNGSTYVVFKTYNRMRRALVRADVPVYRYTRVFGVVAHKAYRVTKRVWTPLPPRKRFLHVQYFRWIRENLDILANTDPRVLDYGKKISDLRLRQHRLEDGMFRLPNRCHTEHPYLAADKPPKRKKGEPAPLYYGAITGLKARDDLYDKWSLRLPRRVKYSRAAGSKGPYAVRIVTPSGVTEHCSDPVTGVFSEPWEVHFFKLDGPVLTASKEAIERIRQKSGRISDHVEVLSDPDKSLGPAVTSAAMAMMSGNVHGSEADSFVPMRSFLELRDYSKLPTQLRELYRFSQTAAYKLGSGRLKGIKALAQFSQVAVGTIKHIAAAYCCYKFAVEPTIADITTLISNSISELVSHKNGLAKYLQGMSRLTLEDPVPLSGGFRGSYEWRQGSFPPSQVLWGYGIFTTEGPDPTGLPYDPYVLSFGGRELVESTASGLKVRQGAVDQLFEEIHEDITSFVNFRADAAGRLFAKFSRDDVDRMLGETILSWRDLLATVIDSTQAVSTTWELLPLSFVVDWFFSTRSTVQTCQNALSAWVGDYKPISVPMASTRQTVTATLVQPYLIDRNELSGRSPVQLLRCASKKAYEDGRWEVWDEGYAEAFCTTGPTGYKFSVGTVRQIMSGETYHRGGFTPLNGVSFLYHSLTSKIRLNRGKLTSLAAIAGSMLTG